MYLHTSVISCTKPLYLVYFITSSEYGIWTCDREYICQVQDVTIIMCIVVWIGRMYKTGSNGMIIIFYRQIQEIVGWASGSTLCAHQALSHCCHCCSLLSLSTELCAASQALSHCLRCCRVHSFCKVCAAQLVLWCFHYYLNCSSLCSAVSASLLALLNSHLSCLSVCVILKMVEYGPLHPRGPINVRTILYAYMYYVAFKVKWVLATDHLCIHMQNTRCICMALLCQVCTSFYSRFLCWLSILR